MKLKNIKVGKKFRQFKDGFLYKKTNSKEADILDKNGKKLCGAIFSRNQVILPEAGSGF